jgi:ABC-type phosphate/phosphonate transport system permease subunit
MSDITKTLFLEITFCILILCVLHLFALSLGFQFIIFLYILFGSFSLFNQPILWIFVQHQGGLTYLVTSVAFILYALLISYIVATPFYNLLPPFLNPTPSLVLSQEDILLLAY